MSENNGNTGFGAGMLIGLLVGTAVALLYAPRSGRETRALLRTKAEESRVKADELIHEAKERARRIIEDAKGEAKANTAG